MGRGWRLGAAVMVAVAMMGGMTCPGGGTGGGTTSPFPKTVAWTPRVVNTDARVRPAAIAVADIDGDMMLDVVVGYAGVDGTSTPAVFIFFQEGLDTFTAVQVQETVDLAGLTAIALGDIDGDTLTDIIVAAEDRIGYLRNAGDPRVAGGWVLSTLDGSTGVTVGSWTDVAISELDGLNGPDVVACGTDTSRLSWFRNPRPDATDGTGWTRVDIDAATRMNASAVLVGDVDGDGRPDVISAAPGEGTDRIAWYRNPPDPLNDAWDKFGIGNLPAVARLAVGDLNADGRNDVVGINPTGRQVGWYQRPVDPTMDWEGFLLTQFPTVVPTDIKVADVDGNGQVDVIVSTQTSGTLRWFTPEGPQTQQWVENNLRDLALDVFRIAVGDIDADGRPDVVAAVRGADTADDEIRWYENPE